MKIKVVKDPSGNIIASYEDTPGHAGLSVAPVLPDGHKVEELEVPENYAENLRLLYSEQGN